MTLLDYWAMVNRTMSGPTEQRYGQAAFNILLHVRPDLAEAVRGTSLDPFYSSSVGPVMSRFSNYLSQNW